MIVEKPYFLENKKWYYHDKKEWKYKLTKEAPKAAIESYKQFYKHLQEHDTIYMKEYIYERRKNDK